MHPNDKVYLLALLFAIPFSSAAPIFTGSKDIDNTGNFLPRGAISAPAKEKRGFLASLTCGGTHCYGDWPSNHVAEKISTMNDMSNDPSMGEPGSSSSEATAKEKRNPLSIPDGMIGPAWIQDERLQPPPFLCSGPPGMCDGDPTTDPFEKREAQGLGSPACAKVGGCGPPRRFGNLPPFELTPTCAGAPGVCPGSEIFSDDLSVSDVIKEKHKKRAVVGELNGVIGTVNQAFDKIAGDIAPNLNPPDIPNIPTKRAVVGELNGVIDTANQAFDKIAGDIAPNLNPPDIPNIPTKRAVDGENSQGLNPPDVPHNPSSRSPFVCLQLGGCDGLPPRFGEIPPPEVLTGLCSGAPGVCPGTELPHGLREKNKKRAVVGEINGVIGTVNKALDKIAGEIAPNLNPPDIPNIPTKRHQEDRNLEAGSVYEIAGNV